MSATAANAALSFVLHPFETSGAPAVSLSGEIVPLPARLLVEYRLKGTRNLLIQPITSLTVRCHELWKQTCFELFFSDHRFAAYYEINLSPSGAWNLYRFDDSRQGMREEAADSLRYRIQPVSDSLIVRLDIDLGRLGLKEKTINVNPCAVLLSREKIPSHWAISHPGPRPDFHDQRTRHFLVSC